MNNNPYESNNPYENTDSHVNNDQNENDKSDTTENTETEPVSEGSNTGGFIFDNTDASNSFYNNSTDNVSNQPAYAPTYPIQPQQASGGNGFSIASLILSIASLVCCGGLIASVLAIIFAAIAKKKGNNSGMTVAGLVIGIISTVIWVFFIVVWFLAVIFAIIEGQTSEIIAYNSTAFLTKSIFCGII